MNQDDFNEAERRSKLRMQVIYEGAKKPKRTWVGLTYEDMIEVWNKLYKERTDVMPLPTTFAKAIEAKLKEKNT
jgi:hypothetical protein